MISQSWNPFLRFPRASLLFTALLCIPFVVEFTDFKVSSETQVLLEGDQRNLSSYQKVKQILAEVEVVVISMECKEVFSPQGMDAVRRVSDAFQKQPGVQDVKSLTHSVKPVRRGFAFEMIPLVPQGATASDLEKLKRFSLDHPLLRNVMVAADSKHTLITVTYQRKLETPESQRMVRREIEATLRPFREEGLGFQILALPLIEEEIRSTLLSDIQWFLPSAVAMLVLILWLTFRSWRILSLVLINQLLVLFLIPGAIRMSGFSLNVFSVILFPLLAGVHLTLLAHLFTAYQRIRPAARDANDAIETVLREVFKSCAFAWITTVIGLASLIWSDVQQVREFGLLGAVGMCLLFFMTFGPGISLLKVVSTRWPLDSSNPSNSSARFGPEHPNPAWAEWLTRFVQTRRRLILGIAAGAVLLIPLGLGRIRTDIRAVEFLNSQSPTRQAVEQLDKVYGGINVVQMEIDSGSENGINQPDYLKYVESVQRFAESRPGVSGAYSYAQLLAMMNQIWEGDRADAFQLPGNALLINLFVLALKSQNYPFLTALCDPSFRTAYLVIRTQDMPSEKYLALLDDIVAFAGNNKPPRVAVSAAQGIHSILEADRRIIRSQIRSAGLTLAVIGLVLTLLWWSPWLALLSLLTNAIPVAFVLAVAGFANIPLNSITIMVAAISLGIAVDDSIHFITQWRDERRKGTQEAVLHSFRVKGRPILFTSVILISIFSVFWFSSFPPIVHFGLLSAIAFFTALLGVLFFLPAMLSCFGRGTVKCSEPSAPSSDQPHAR